MWKCENEIGITLEFRPPGVLPVELYNDKDYAGRPGELLSILPEFNLHDRRNTHCPLFC